MNHSNLRLNMGGIALLTGLAIYSTGLWVRRLFTRRRKLTVANAEALLVRANALFGADQCASLRSGVALARNEVALSYEAQLNKAVAEAYKLVDQREGGQ